MPDQLQFRGGTTAQHASFTGASKEITVDTTKKTVVVHDGSTVGGNPVMREDGSNSSLALGSAASPSLKFAGGTTGIYSPGSGQLAISTSGAQRLVVDASGNVGAGVASPGARLHVLQGATPNIAQLYIGQGGGSSNYYDANNHYFRTGNLNSVITATDSLISLHTSAQERLRITSSGLVGVGTSSPATLLHLNSAAATNTTLAYSENGALKWYNRYNASDGSFQIVDVVNTATRLHISNTGNVGVGTTSPTLKLSVDGDVWFGNGSGVETGRLFNDAGVLHLRASSNVTGLALGSNGTERLRITSAGLVGIGTSTATLGGNSFRLAVVGTKTYSELIPRDGLAIADNTATAQGVGGSITLHGIYDGSGNYTAFGGIEGQKENGTSGNYAGALVLKSRTFLGNLNEAIRIDSSQRVGIGNTNPQHLLDCASIGRFAGNTNSAASGAGIEIGYDAGNTTGFIQSYNRGSSTYLSTAVDGSDVRFKTSGAEKARLTASGQLLVGTSSSRGLATANAGSIQIESVNTYATASMTTNSPDSNGSYFILGKSRGSSAGSNTIVNNGDDIGGIFFAGANGSGTNYAASIYSQVDGTPGANNMPGRIVLSTTAAGASSPTERMRISNSGVSAIISAGNVFAAEYTGAAGTDVRTLYAGHSSTGFGTRTISFQVWSNGNVQNTNNSYGSISDIKLKENIVDANSQWNDVKAFRVRNYNLKSETNQQTHTQIGLIAQEAEIVSPGLVYESPDHDAEGNDLGTVTKSVNYSVLYMKAVKALQEAMERIEQLEAKVAALETA